MRVLLLDDDPRLVAFLARGLEEEGHSVEVASSLREARTAIALSAPDLLLADRQLPDGDGLVLVRELRAKGAGFPVLVLSARDAVQDRVEGLYGGADDYLVKPFSFDELLARIAALTRRTAIPGAPTSVGGLTIDLVRDRVFAGPQEVTLTAQEFKLLRYLAEQPGRVVSRTRLLEHVWGLHHDPGSNVVDVYVRYLRNKLAQAGVAPLIHTVRGRGYVFEERAS